MSRLDPETLADHLDAALLCSTRDVILALAHPDGLHRHKAIRELANRLAERMQWCAQADTLGKWQAPQLFD